MSNLKEMEHYHAHVMSGKEQNVIRVILCSPLCVVFLIRLGQWFVLY